MQADTPHGWMSFVLPALIIGIVLALRLRGMSRMRRLRVEQLWIVPALYALVAATMFYQFPPAGIVGWALCAVALGIGVALGWQRGKMMRIEVDPETHAINQKASPAALIFIVALIALRSVMRSFAVEEQGWLHLNAFTLTDMLVAMALGLLATQRLEMYLRASRLLAEARATRGV